MRYSPDDLALYIKHEMAVRDETETAARNIVGDIHVPSAGV